MHADILTTEELESHGLHSEFKKRIIALKNPKVLDWGCGRGADVLHLRKSGIQAFGTEPDHTAIERGKPLFTALGIDHAATIKPLSEDNKTAFPDNSFDLITSYYVLEHVEDLDSVAKEMARLLKPGGICVNLFPSHLSPIEGHLKMPCVHWLPKGKLRFAAIYACTLLGIEPKPLWPIIASANRWGRAKRYQFFSTVRTFYRPPREIKRAFRKAGLEPSFEARKHDRIVRSPLAKLPAPLLEWGLSNFAGSVLVGTKR